MCCIAATLLEMELILYDISLISFTGLSNHPGVSYLLPSIRCNRLQDMQVYAKIAKLDSSFVY